MNKNEIKKSNINNNILDIESKFNRNNFSLNDLIELLKKEKKDINHGLCGSINLGNTCYLNSSIACLSNCYELTYYFLSKKFKNDINKSNKEGTKGNLANEWYDLLKQYWKTKKSYGNPSALKKVIGNKINNFKGHNQQDANEFMIYFLDIINEDLNRISKKYYKEIDEQKEDETDDECALRFWTYNYQRNDSIITDLFTGLFKCTVKCPNCNWVSITYETFNILQLSIPKEKYHKPEKKIKIELFYVPKYGLYDSLRIQFSITNKNLTLNQLIEEIKKLNLISFQLNKLFFYLVVDKKLKDINNGNKIYKECENSFIFFCDDFENDNQNEKIHKIPLFFYIDNEKSAFPRFLFLNKNMKLIDLLNISYLYIRKYINPPHNEYSDKINQYFQNPQYIEKLINLINKEFKLFFLNEKTSNEIQKFINNKPFELILYNKEDEFNLFKLSDTQNETNEVNNDNIKIIIDYLTNINFKIKIILKKNNPYIKKKFSLNSCQVCKEENNNFINNNNNYNNNDKITIYDCFEQFKESENLKNNNEWYCKKCKKNILAEKQILFYYLPKLFIISLKRFKNKNGYFYKNNKYVDFPLKNLNLNKVVCGFDKNNNIYDCFAICQHFGDMEVGHYTAVCKNVDNKWYNYDDESCYLCDEQNIISSEAYIIFFRRKNN